MSRRALAGEGREGRKEAQPPCGHLGLCACSQPPYHKTQGCRCSANGCVGVETYPQMAGGRAGGVNELLNKATLALNFEPGSAGAGHGDGVMGGVGGDLCCEEDVYHPPAP